MSRGLYRKSHGENYEGGIINMTNMDNEQWLLAMELFDNDYGVTKDSKIVNDTIMNMKKILTNKERYEIRKVKALEIIAETLISIDNKMLILMRSD